MSAKGEDSGALYNNKRPLENKGEVERQPPKDREIIKRRVILDDDSQKPFYAVVHSQ